MMEQESLFSEEVANGRPENRDKIALIDADTLVYAVCSVCEIGDDEAGYQIDLVYAEETAINKIKMILEETGCSDAELHFTAGKNFRYLVDPNYKSNRSDQRTPVGLGDLKAILTAMFFQSKIHTEIESDDYVVWAKKYFPAKYILCAVDKDVLNSVSGEHYNYYKNDKYSIKPKWVTTCEKTPNIWFHFQVLMGDSGDGIPGIPGMGPVKAIEAISKDLAVTAKAVRKEKYKSSTDLLKVCLDENLFCDLDLTNLWDIVVSTYEANNLTEKDAVRMARLVSMHQLNKEGDLDLWTKNLVE